MTIDRARAAFFIGANLVFLTTAATAQAADASAWDGTQRSAVRLIAGTRVEGGAALRAGIEMRVAPGWKTYWRYPGDSGVPPRFDFSKSRNVKSVNVRWPAPQRLADESGTPAPAEDRLHGTMATITAAILKGAHIVRVHDVKAAAETIRVTESIRENLRTM